MLRLTYVALTGFCLAAGCAQQPAAIARSGFVKVGGAGTAEAPCFVEVDGARMPLQSFTAFAERWRDREVHLEGDARVPYRCVGGVIYALERVRARIGFISAPPADQAR